MTDLIGPLVRPSLIIEVKKSGFVAATKEFGLDLDTFGLDSLLRVDFFFFSFIVRKYLNNCNVFYLPCPLYRFRPFQHLSRNL
jgi:hypothetical protein